MVQAVSAEPLGRRKMDLIILGDSQVGKTSILKRYKENKFSREAISTIGVDFITMPFKPDDGP